MTTIRIKRLVTSGNAGDGLRIEGDVDFVAGEVQAEGNRGRGVAVINHAPLMEQFGFPKETDPIELAKALQMLQNVPAEKRADTARESGMLERLWKGAIDTTTLLNNLVSLASNPSVQDFIANLLH